MLIFLVQAGIPTLFPKRCFCPAFHCLLNKYYLASFLSHALQSILFHELNYVFPEYDEQEARLEQNSVRQTK